ncbi:MAG: LytTR family DNA-binding domain-containing protein [Ferruginibacter sp.]
MTNNTQNIHSENSYRLTLATSEGTYYFSPEHIVRLKSSSSYTNIYFTNRKPILASKVLKEFEEELAPFGFLRTHKSHLVNRKYVAHVAPDGNIIMNDDSRAEISRRKKTEVLKLLKTNFPIIAN